MTLSSGPGNLRDRDRDPDKSQVNRHYLHGHFERTLSNSDKLFLSLLQKAPYFLSQYGAGVFHQTGSLRIVRNKTNQKVSIFLCRNGDYVVKIY